MCICMTGKHSAVCLSRLAGTAIAIDSRALLFHRATHLLAVKHPLSFLTPSFVFQSADMTGWVSCSRHGDANDHDEAGAASSTRL